MSVEAVLCLSQNQPHKALKLLNQATDLRPDIGKLWSNKAVAYVTLKRPQDALNCANREHNKNMKKRSMELK